MSDADPSGSTPETAGDVQTDSHAAEAGARAGEEHGGVVENVAYSKCKCKCFMFMFVFLFSAGVGFTKPTAVVLRVSPGKLRIGIYRGRTCARFTFILGLVP